MDDFISKNVLQKYLDNAITKWRIRKNESVEDSEDMWIAACYVDAFQSVRVSMLGELLSTEQGR